MNVERASIQKTVPILQPNSIQFHRKRRAREREKMSEQDEFFIKLKWAQSIFLLQLEKLFKNLGYFQEEKFGQVQLVTGNCLLQQSSKPNGTVLRAVIRFFAIKPIDKCIYEVFLFYFFFVFNQFSRRKYFLLYLFFCQCWHMRHGWNISG